ncbi:SDR16C5 [Mytilus edulis]|uniref:SDR16C5 n=1 Tax=Mytilus edulis TaxID=6550 RepID=A0A8S3SFQ9_MYTED|nr:SDR16C5 [Mytilus edulis]
MKWKHLINQKVSTYWIERIQQDTSMFSSLQFLGGISIILAFIPWSWRAKDVAGETVLVTGAGSGIGRLIALRFARLGCRLVLWDVNDKGNEETAKQIKALGAYVKTYKIDLSNRDDIYSVAAKTKEEAGDIDILVNNAGIVTGKKFLECSDNMIQKTFEVNTLAHFWTCKAFLPGMMERNHGHIVTIASSAGYLGVNGLSDYCASKFAAVGFDESMRFELEMMGKEVKTTVICPFYINTGMFDGAKTRWPFILPILEPEDTVNKIVDAVLCNQHIVMLPKSLYFFMALKGVLPCKVLSCVCYYFGVSNVMDNFRGKSTKTD